MCVCFKPLYCFVWNGRNKIHSATDAGYLCPLGLIVLARTDEKRNSKRYNEMKYGIGIHASGFKDFILKPECLRAVSRLADSNIHPKSNTNASPKQSSEWTLYVKCQAKSGMVGKTAVFVLATLHHQLNHPSAFPTGENQVSVLLLCHTRKLAFQIAHEYEHERFSK